MAIPSPVPPCDRVSLSSAWVELSKIRSSWFAAMPMPLSATKKVNGRKEEMPAVGKVIGPVFAKAEKQCRQCRKPKEHKPHVARVAEMRTAKHCVHCGPGKIDGGEEISLRLWHKHPADEHAGHQRQSLHASSGEGEFARVRAKPKEAVLAVARIEALQLRQRPLGVGRFAFSDVPWGEEGVYGVRLTGGGDISRRLSGSG